MTQQGAGLGEQALNKAVEIGLSSQLDEVKNLEVEVKTDPFKLMSGELESVSIEGEGLVMENDLRADELRVNTGKISINPLSAAFGKIELNHPTDADAHVVLKEEDINRAFNSEFLREKLQNLEVNINGQPTTIDTKRIDFRLPGDQKVALTADILLSQTNEQKKIEFTATPRKSPDGYSVLLEDVQYSEGKDLSPDLTKTLLDKANELLDLRNFELEGMSLRLKALDVQAGKMNLQAQARVEQFPSA
ncbi:MAG TPA: DUF2993 domain-containing protein [Candidatus Sericytochromatia bacterium]